LIPEIDRPTAGLVRIPPGMDVPLSPRVRRLLDTTVMKRLSEITQLGLVHLVYPGAKHSRLEHSLGVYRNAILFLQSLGEDARFRQLVSVRGAEAFVLAALLHDAGHWPYCHAIEDMRLASIPRHEARVEAIVARGEVADLIAQDWHCSGDDVLSLLAGRAVERTSLSTGEVEFLASCISGPVDVDKLDYLVRDSLHAGVPYGRNFDAARLLASLAVHPERPRLSITEKGRTAAEMMVFSRYVMFSEVYWHHTVRAATAMLQRLVFELQTHLDIPAMLEWDDATWIRQVTSIAEGKEASTLAKGLFGPSRRLYKRAAEFNILERADLHRGLAHRPYWWLVACGDELARIVSRQLSVPVDAVELLLDAPPVKLEVDINMDVVGRGGVARGGEVHKLGDVSPVAHVLAHQQFDGHVKRVRVFVSPHLREAVAELLEDDRWIQEAVETINREVV
jgi:uncharacterized protein